MQNISDAPITSASSGGDRGKDSVVQKVAGQDQTGAGFPARSVLIIDSIDRVRYHCVLDSRMAFNVGDIARLSRGFLWLLSGGEPGKAIGNAS